MKALIVRFSAIGDCVMAVPVAVSIREKYPDAEIVWAVEPYCSPVINTATLVNEVALYPRDEWERNRWSPKTWRNQLKTYASMRKRDFDLGIDLQGQAKTAICLRMAKPKKRIASKGHDFLSQKLNPVLSTTRGQMHTIEHSMMALRELGDFSSDIRFVMPSLEKEQSRVCGLVKGDRPLATISISTGQVKKQYPVEGWVEVAKGLMQRGYEVAFLGGRGDPASPLPEALNWVGTLNLSEAMAAVKLSAIHLAADTGTGHMSAAYGVPVVSVFGRTKTYWYRPYTTNGIVLDGQGSMNITPQQILEAADNLAARSEAISS